MRYEYAADRALNCDRQRRRLAKKREEKKAKKLVRDAAPDLLAACEVALLAMTHEPLNPKDVAFVKAAITKAKPKS